MKNDRKSVCKICKEEKSTDEFPQHVNTPQGHHPYCRVCYKKYHDSRKHLYQYKYPFGYLSSNYIPYSISHPEKWKSYYNEYVDKHKENNPLFEVKQVISTRLMNMRKAGEFVKPPIGTPCSNCGNNTTQLRAYVTDEFAIKYKESYKDKPISRAEILKNIKWRCHKCICATRKNSKK